MIINCEIWALLLIAAAVTVVVIVVVVLVVAVVAVEKERFTFPNDRQFFTVRLYLLSILKWGSGTRPNLELTTRLIRPFAVMFYRPLDLKNTRPKALPDTDTQHVQYSTCPCTDGNSASAWVPV